jgi:hypothetical protein
MTEWLKDHVAAIGSFKTQHFGLLAKTWLKWRSGGAIRRKWGQLVGKVGE